MPIPLPDLMTTSEISNLLKHEDKLPWLVDTPLSDILNKKFLENGELKPTFKDSIVYRTTLHGVSKAVDSPLLMPLELELDIDGIGGIYPGNSYNSDFVPKRYQETTIFQMFDVGHKIDSSGWTTSINGKMRLTLGEVMRWKTDSEIWFEQWNNFKKKADKDEQDRVNEENLKAKKRLAPGNKFSGRVQQATTNKVQN